MIRKLLWLCTIPPLLFAQEYRIKSNALVCGGNFAFSSQSRVRSSMGQPAVENAFSTSYRVKSGFWHATTSVATVVSELFSAIPKVFHLYHSYPNPFNPVTTIVMDVPRPCRVKLTVYDILGKQVKNLLYEDKPAGRFTLQWDGSNQNGVQLPSGLYIYRMEAEEFISSQNMILVR